jgi:zinc/manganese transport system ATP-binding protein
MALDAVGASYGGEVALRRVTGTIRRGSRIALVGPNGAGKSTLLKIIKGLKDTVGGTLRAGCDPATEIAYLPQDMTIDTRFPIAVRDLVAMGNWRRKGAFGAFDRDDLARLDRALAAFGLDSLADRPIVALSGGEMRRALLARIAVDSAPLLLLDEPFANLDRDRTLAILAMLAEWTSAGRAVLVVLHDLELALRHFPETILLARDCLGWGPTEAVLTPENWQRARELLDGFPMPVLRASGTR